MPTLPAPVARTALRVFGSPAQVCGVDDLSPGLRRVELRCDALADREFGPGCEVEFLVDDRHFRHHSPCGHDGDTLVILFHRPTAGPGGRWSDALRPRMVLDLLGPGRARHSPRPLRAPALLLGDASALGVLGWLTAEALAHGVPVHGAVEVPAPDVEVAAGYAPGLDVIVTAHRPGAALHEWLGREPHRAGEQAVCLGHAQSLQSLRTELLSRGVPRRSITTRPYWSTGRTGL